MLKNLDPSKFPLRLEGGCEHKKLLPIAARVHERISEIPTIEVHFFCANKKLDLESIVGKKMHLVCESEDKAAQRWFRGTCISAEFMADRIDGGQFRAIIRPWLWFLTRRTDLRIFQGLSVVDIIQSVIGKYGLNADLDLKLSHTYPSRDYCVQYRETDLDFLHRLMEEEGIYYYFDHSKWTEKLVLIDDCGKHEAIAEPSSLEYREYSMKSNLETSMPYVMQWSAAETVRSAKVVLNDYNFKKPHADLTSASENVQAGSRKDVYERYDYPGHFRDSGIGDYFARVRMDAESVTHHLVSGISDAINLAVGYTFSISKLPREKDPKDVMLIECEHKLVQIDMFGRADFTESADMAKDIDFSLNPDEPHEVKFRVVDSRIQYRAPLKTAWPKVGGIHTAVVTGPEGEEIYTDQYGRIRVQFHWDRDGQNDDRSTCWVRTMMPWTGKNWGAIAIPRIGQEVVISFEEGDPDRPICIGMLYNDKNRPPYDLPADKTQSGIKTNSSKEGGGFNELMFEDKKGEELVRVQAEKDFEHIVNNDQTETTFKHKKQTVGESYNLQIGNKTAHSDMMSSASKLISQLRFGASPSLAGALKMAYDGLMSAAADNKFNETIEGAHGHVVTLDHSQFIGAKHDHNVLGKFAQTIGLAHDHLVGVDYTQEIKRNHKQTVDDDYIQTIKGKNTKTVTKDMTTKVEQGDITIEAKLGQIDISAMKKIVLKVGSSSIELSPSGIAIEGPMIQIKGYTMTEVKGGGSLILKGGLTMIN
ncbi:type VI secretion system Vgr family protein [Marivita sp.]|uniref:type VI secretion system Vgr family protein n=1 Tax=Marivita sp. TaxID=2003365 RepID=UPI0025BC7FE5|nr:type VI secretion system tip protein TssI/VgrG [Marivita sp.]